MFYSSRFSFLIFCYSTAKRLCYLRLSVFVAVRNDYYTLGEYFYFRMHFRVALLLVYLFFFAAKKDAWSISRFFYGLFNPWRVYAAVRNDYYTLGGYFYVSIHFSEALRLISLRFFTKKRMR